MSPTFVKFEKPSLRITRGKKDQRWGLRLESSNGDITADVIDWLIKNLFIVIPHQTLYHIHKCLVTCLWLVR